jgi:hypothetical protein
MVKNLYQKCLFIAFLASFWSFLDVLPISASDYPIIIENFYHDTANGDLIKIRWKANFNATPDTVQKYTMNTGGIGSSFFGAYHEVTAYYWSDFLNSCSSTATSDICYSIPKELKFYDGNNTSTIATNASGLTYSDVTNYLDINEATPINNVYGTRYAIGGGSESSLKSVDPFGFGETPVYSLNPHIVISSPASGSTITATNDILSVNYYDIDPTLYKGILLNFRDDKLHASTKSYDYKLATGDTGNGSFSVNTSEFDFDTNGHWDLHGLAYGVSLDIQGGAFLTTRGYVDVFSNELVDPAYYLIFNVAGYQTPFTFDDWATWYGTNVSDYATPEPIATTLAGYLRPYFEKVGGFGSQASLYFNLNEAYDRGFGLGEIFPAVDGYIKKIDMFFGGFPLFTFFKYIIYTLIGIFVIRTILKFIPFIG